VEGSLRPLLQRKLTFWILSSRHHWIQLPNLLLAPLPKAACSKKGHTVLLEIRKPIANNCKRWRGAFEVLSLHEERAEFAINLRVFLFKEGLWIFITSSKIYLAG
jgi:hypothetical protein